MTTKDKLIHVEFKDGFFIPTSDNIEGKHHYFGSIKAIFETFTPKQLGCGISVLYQFKISSLNTYENKRCVIREGKVKRKKTNRTAPVRVIRVNN